MKLTANKNPSLDNDYVDLRYRELTPEIHQIMSLCENSSTFIIGELNKKKVNIDIHDVFYIEWVESKSCICTANEVFTSAVTLSRFEELLVMSHFIRISKSFLVNIFKIRSVSSGINMKLTAELINGENVIVSRHYRDKLLSDIHQLSKGAGK